MALDLKTVLTVVILGLTALILLTMLAAAIYGLYILYTFGLGLEAWVETLPQIPNLPEINQ